MSSARSRRNLTRSAVAIAATAASLLTIAGTASAAPGSASRNGHTLSASNATGLAVAGEVVTVTGTGYNPANGYYVALCQVPDDYSYGVRPAPCAGGDGQGSTGVGPSAWVTNSPLGGNAAYPIAADGGFTAQIHVKEATTGLDCATVTCAIVSRRDHFATNDRTADVFIPVSFG